MWWVFDDCSMYNNIYFYLSSQYFDTECCWFQYLFFQPQTDINMQKINPAKHRQCSVCHLLYFTSWKIHQALFSPSTSWWVRACLTAPSLGSWNRPSVGGQRVSSDRNPRTRAVIWLPVIPVVPWVCCHCCCFLSRCWQMARWTHSGWLWRFPQWNQNTGPGPLLMECQMPAVQGAARERWKTAIYHGRWGNRSASGDCPS